MFSKHPLDSDASILNQQDLISHIFIAFQKLPLLCLTCQDGAQEAAYGHTNELLQGKGGRKEAADTLLCRMGDAYAFIRRRCVGSTSHLLEGSVFSVWGLAVPIIATC